MQAGPLVVGISILAPDLKTHADKNFAFKRGLFKRFYTE
jgi:hypothetical protein